jgi:cold shock CspA family protein
MGSSAGPYQMDREPGAPFGVFNLAKFRAEVRSRVDVARKAGDAAGSSSYMNTGAYDAPPPRTAGTAHSHGSQSVNLESRLLSRDADEAMEKMQRRAESTLSHARFPPLDSKDASRRSTSSLDVVRAPRSSAFMAPDPFKHDRMQWTTPEKWYSLSQHSAQNNSHLPVARNQTQRPAMPTKPSENPFSCPPARINKFSDISPNPRLIDGKKKKRRGDESSPKAAKVGLAKFGHMRKCQNPFTEGWKVATFKPAREKLVPYTACVKKWIKGSGYGFIDLDGQEIFVHQSEVKSGKPLKPGESVTFLLHSGVTGRRGLPEAHKVVPDDGQEHIPENMVLFQSLSVPACCAPCRRQLAWHEAVSANCSFPFFLRTLIFLCLRFPLMLCRVKRSTGICSHGESSMKICGGCLILPFGSTRSQRRPSLVRLALFAFPAEPRGAVDISLLKPQKGWILIA